MEGNILVRCEISVSVGTRKPALARSVRPVNSSTSSRMTDGDGISAVAGVRARAVALLGLGGLAVVIASSLESALLRTPCVLVSSGSARFVLRGGRSEPTSGARKRSDNRTTAGGSRYVLKPARSERYIWPVKAPTTATVNELGSWPIASYDVK